MLELNEHVSHTALSPLDGRYHSQLSSLANIFSEFSLNKHRLHVEVEYLIFLSKKSLIPTFVKDEANMLRAVAKDFSLADAEELKALEKVTRHDVKAVEYFLRQRITELNLPNEQFVHLAMTSEDTNSLAYALMTQDGVKTVLLPELRALLKLLSQFADENSETTMLARTHGQPAVPTTVGKEMVVFAARLYEELMTLEKIDVEGKLSGAVGNFNAHAVAFPDMNWLDLSTEFVRSLGLKPSTVTTQIVPAESYSRMFASLQRINLIFLDLNQDVWRYISDGYFLQKKDGGQVGSSTMPQKINPIDFENSEGNLGLANALLSFFIQKLPISRLQRDLSDSTVKRNFGAAFGYCQLAYLSLQKGLSKLTVNDEKLAADLDQHWEVLAEALQVLLRKNGDNEGYEKLKTFSQGKQLTQSDIAAFIDSLEITDEERTALHDLTPDSYVGIAPLIVEQEVSRIKQYLQGVS